MLASKSPNLFNDNMDTKHPLNSQIRNRGLKSGLNPARLMTTQTTHSATAASPAEVDWQTSGLIDQMSAYRDWWNLPARKPLAAEKSAAKIHRPTKIG